MWVRWVKMGLPGPVGVVCGESLRKGQTAAPLESWAGREMGACSAVLERFWSGFLTITSLNTII